MTNRVKTKTGKVRKVREDVNEDFRRMLELYTLVPPRPGMMKKKRKAGNKKS
jgi:hypothetical protein